MNVPGSVLHARKNDPVFFGDMDLLDRLTDFPLSLEWKIPFQNALDVFMTYFRNKLPHV